VSATLFALEEYFKVQAGSPGAESMVSSKPCQWNIPCKCKVENVVISRCKFKKHEHGKAKIEKDITPDEPTPSVPAPAKHNLLKNTRFSNYLYMVKQTELKTGKKVGLSFWLPQKIEHELKRGLLHDHNYANKDHSQVQTEMPHKKYSDFSYQSTSPKPR